MTAQAAYQRVSTYWVQGWRTAWFAIFLLGVSLRLLRLSWQPLWWDEGYSIYFATEPLPTMFWLTARDIHPPLYYAFLHLWFALVGSTGPETARIFSALVGVATLPLMTWASLTLWPTRRWLALIATFLLAINPIHIFYSQEIRMYGLALLLTLAASTFLWRMQEELAQGNKPYRSAAGYVITASLALLTLYYTGFLLLAHQIWALYAHRTNWHRLRWFLLAAILILIIQLPWWLYALPRLFTYIADKVTADQDVALPIWAYLWRHWLAFFAGHVPAGSTWLEIARQLIAALIAIVLLVSISIGNSSTRLRLERYRLGWLLCLVLTTFLVGFVVNLTYPFFPEGGERLLLQTLPYLILGLISIAGRLVIERRVLATTMLTLPLLAAILGNTIFFTTPRYVNHDYRPLINYVLQNSRPNDTVLAIFPWQVGYWRAYSPRSSDGALLPPQPAPVEQEILRWDETFATRLATELTEGTIWFPMPLSFGSTLPGEIENYLQTHARNLENQWYSPATRLSAWVRLADTPEPTSVAAAYPESATATQSEVTLSRSGIAPTTVTSANTPLAIDLCWQPAVEREDLRATLRLLDTTGYVWAKRDLTPLAAYARTSSNDACLEAIALNVPAGLPPGPYQLAIGVGPQQSDQLFTPANGTISPLVTIGQVDVTAPSEALSPQRLPIEHWLRAPVEAEGLALLGHAGLGANATILAGDEVALTLFLQSTEAQVPRRNLYISLLDSAGNGMDGWEGWPLLNYPTEQWTEGTLAQVPIQFYLRPDLPAGDYTLTAGFLDAVTGDKTEPVPLTKVEVVRRATVYTPPEIESSITPTVQFGTHARLVGYEMTQNEATLRVTLAWEVLQPLLPPHHIFVHVFDTDNQRIAQSDSAPVTLDGRAPTSSWLPGEYLLTEHTLTLPDTPKTPLHIQTGLYHPTTGERLPTTVDGTPTGNSVTLPIATSP